MDKSKVENSGFSGYVRAKAPEPKLACDETCPVCNKAEEREEPFANTYGLEAPRDWEYNG